MSALVVLGETPFLDVPYLRDQLEDVTLEVRSLETEADVTEVVAEADALVVDVHTPVTAEAIEAAEDHQLSLIARCGTGFDNIDVETATKYGIAVTNAPDYCMDEVATHAFGLFLACRRRIPAADREIRNGEWDWQTDRPIRRVPGSTLGLVSFGEIARRVADYAAGFDLDILVYDPFVDEAVVEEYGAELVEFEALLEGSDAISVHAPLTNQTRGMFDADALSQMRDHAVLVNVGRGGIIDEVALADALENEEIAAAGLDVLEEEPPEETPILGLEDVVLTPHSGWYSIEARRDLNRTVATQIDQVLSGDQPDYVVDPDWN